MSHLKFAVIGGGIIGSAIARELGRSVPDASITLFEKETSLGAHQTGHNSGVVHAGLYYEPGGMKAALCRQGVELLTEYAAEKNIPFEQCGKLVIAHHPEEFAGLDNILTKATANKVPGIRLIAKEEIKEIEPHARGLRALHSPSTAIINYVAMTEALGQDVRDAGGSVLLGTKVTKVTSEGDTVKVQWDGGEDVFDLVIACAGLQADRLGSGERSPRIIPFFGDYYALRLERSELVRGLLYPVPNPLYPFLGVHLTKMIDGTVTVGPNAFLSLAREGYGRLNINVHDVFSTLSFGGFWKFAAKNIPAAMHELRTNLSQQAMFRAAQTFVPELAPGDIVRHGRGVRAQAMDSSGKLLDDFAISQQGRLIQLRNAPSPGATASMAIARHIVTTALGNANLLQTNTE